MSILQASSLNPSSISINKKKPAQAPNRCEGAAFLIWLGSLRIEIWQPAGKLFCPLAAALFSEHFKHGSSGVLSV